MNQTQNRRWTQVLRKGKKFLFHFTSDTSRATVKRHAHHLIWKLSWKQKDYDLWQWKYWSCMNSNLMNAHRTNNPSHQYKMALMPHGVGITFPSGALDPPGFYLVSAVQSLVFCVVFCRSLFIIFSFSFGNCIVCPSSIYGFWFAVW